MCKMNFNIQLGILNLLISYERGRKKALISCKKEEKALTSCERRKEKKKSKPRRNIYVHTCSCERLES